MLTVRDSLLVVVDIQESLARVMHGRDALFENLQKMIKGARILEIPMIATEQVPEKLGGTVPEISPLLENASP
ncbi:MAG: isochorismatase family protein, partial [Syntrophaceae bacterium]|nr:isochorismatase family protein [Syntrophaceae bacterium]